MADKIEYEPKYFSVKKPVMKEVVVTKYIDISDGAGTHGKKIGNVGANTHLIVDTLEDDEGDIRIVRVVGYVPPPIPKLWEDAQLDKPREAREWWVDKGAVVNANADLSKIVLQVTWDNATSTGTVVRL
jgi:hypothetical protein